MNDDGNPTDDALENEARHDVPVTLGGRGHRPKLGTETRAINPRAQLFAEQEAQARDHHQRQPYMQPLPPPAPPPRSPGPREAYDPWAHETGYAYSGHDVPRRVPAHVLPFRSRREAPTEPPCREDPPPTHAGELEAWDAYASAALPVVMTTFPTWTPHQVAQTVACFADALVNLRRDKDPFR